MSRPDTLELGRRAHAAREWAHAFDRLSAADREAALGPGDLECLARAAWLTGRDPQCEELLARAYRAHLDLDDQEQAAGSAFWLGFVLLRSGEHARASGWLARAQRLLDEGDHDCVIAGYLLIPAALARIGAADFATGYDLFTRAAALADRFDDADLCAFARHGQGRALIRLGETVKGTALLDEAMVAVEAGEVSPIIAGTVYCSVIEACTELFDVQRAREWTSSLSRWCESQPDLVPFRGQCLIRRAEILQLRGAWDEAMAEAQHARERLSEPPPPKAAVGLALYREAELHRLRGEFELAEHAYREASRWSRTPRPGLALLRLAQGHPHRAAAAIPALLDEAGALDVRSTVLAASVEIRLACGDVVGARAAADELSRIAENLDVPFMHALAGQALGAVLLAEGDARAAHAALQRAWTLWQELDAPYEAARTRVDIGRACRTLGDADTAAIELDAACWALQELGAEPDRARVVELLADDPKRQHGGVPGTSASAGAAGGAASPTAPGATAPTPSTAAGAAAGLTRRELEVLRLVARGDTNRAIAAELFISDRTVHRHVSNIFAKLGVSTRSAATAWAFEHRVV